MPYGHLHELWIPPSLQQLPLIGLWVQAQIPQATPRILKPLRLPPREAVPAGGTYKSSSPGIIFFMALLSAVIVHHPALGRPTFGLFIITPFTP
jgi:hypothetical protein